MASGVDVQRRFKIDPLHAEEETMFGKVKDLRELFTVELKYAYDCEKKLVDKGLPTMIQNASAAELRTALQQHLSETQTHVVRLEKIFSSLGEEPKTESNEIFDKMSSAVKDSIGHIEQSPLRDAALIVNGNIVEHYEIATYGSLAAFAKHLGLAEAAALLGETLEEEKQADAKLTQIGEGLLNPQAVKRQNA
jgi:ferritin-like metal-binding protein YciE